MELLRACVIQNHRMKIKIIKDSLKKQENEHTDLENQ